LSPAGVSRKEHDQKQTRIDFYMRQIENCASKLLKVRYILADGFYAKTKVFDTITRMNKHLITKLRPDANLRYLVPGRKLHLIYSSMTHNISQSLF
ncbi:MAG: hypothetical protein AAF696_34685, partial [Bacteroidota bacterium]